MRTKVLDGARTKRKTRKIGEQIREGNSTSGNKTGLWNKTTRKVMKQWIRDWRLWQWRWERNKWSVNEKQRQLVEQIIWRTQGRCTGPGSKKRGGKEVVDRVTDIRVGYEATCLRNHWLKNEEDHNNGSNDIIASHCDGQCHCTACDFPCIKVHVWMYAGDKLKHRHWG